MPPPGGPISSYPYEIVMISCPEQEEEATWVGGAVLDVNSEPVMEGVMVEYWTLSNRGKTPWAEDLKTQPVGIRHSQNVQARTAG
jgi:protocatechuate 3,4-dioxygenase beta subunit